jgi:hypothetical protein
LYLESVNQHLASLATSDPQKVKHCCSLLASAAGQDQCEVERVAADRVATSHNNSPLRTTGRAALQPTEASLGYTCHAIVSLRYHRSKTDSTAVTWLFATGAAQGGLPPAGSWVARLR